MTKMKRGFGYVKFGNFIDYSNSFSLNGSYLDGRPILVSPISAYRNNKNSIMSKKLEAESQAIIKGIKKINLGK